MNSGRWVLLTGSLLALAACGSHNNHAPVVYGTDPARQTRVYHSPDEIRAEQRAQRTASAQQPAYQPPAYQPANRQARTASVEPVQLTPLTAVYLDDQERAARKSEYTPVAATTQAAAPEPHLHKAKGYVEVQRGDTVYALARKFNVTPASIIDANNLKAPYALSVGQIVKLPDGATALVADAPTRRVVAQDRLYTVRAGDTLYSISRATGAQVTTIADANNLRAPYSLDIGRQLVIPSAPTGTLQAAAAPKQTQAAASEPAPKSVSEIARSVSYTKPEPASPASMFAWPVHGQVVSAYGSGILGRRNDGVNIAAPLGAGVRAAADGTVVYRGAELEGFGNLLLIKHADGFVTAYAHNDAMLVKKGDVVRKGQVIAKVGQTGAVTTPQLHFEIRQELQTIDPVALLGKP
ncbi:MAG: M23 family metallopeptidase [Parvularculaceae bacterium]